ncbi:MAG TPA: alginate export family protein [Terriglobales bacterium]|nr:alginate export family protein [Terriglobales bacterium]
MKFGFVGSTLAVFLLGSSFVVGQQSQPADSKSDSHTQLAQVDALPAPQTPPAAAKSPEKHKVGPFDISVNWRTRTEGWNWFEGNTGNSDYPFFDSLLRVGIGQNRERLEWFVEGETASIAGLPNDAVVAAPQGQLGLGGTYYAANGNQTNNTGGFLKQAYVNFKHLGPTNVKLGRFEFFDGLEVKPADPTLATVIQTRIAHRMISNFGFAAVQRTFDGGQFSWNSGANNITFFGARPTQGVFQVKGMDELDVQIYYGAFNHAVTTPNSAGELRVFALGYVDGRNTILKTDDRPSAVRAADLGEVEIATYGADYAHVLKTESAGKFDFLAWGALQVGSWGALTQRAGAFVGEAGWQAPVKLKPWFSMGYSYGSGDGKAKDGTNGTFFQLLTTPRQYARFPFYNMMNNEDAYATLNLKPWSKLAFRSEAHSLRLASASDLWYLGGGAFQPNTFGFTGRPSGGKRSLANVWDLSADYNVNRYFSTTIYYGHAWGKSVIENIYPKNPNGQLAFLETNFHF